MSVVEPDQALEQFREAVHGLYLASVRSDRDLATESANQLIALRASDIDRLFHLHAIASTTNRAPELVTAGGVVQENVASAFAGAIEGVEAIDQRTPEQLVAGLVRFAEAADRERTGLTPERWRTFLVETREPGFDAGNGPEEAESRPRSPSPAAAELAPRLPLLSKPGCNDDEVIGTPQGAAATVRSRFWVDRELEDAARFIDPQNWVACGRPFWEQMVLDQGTVTPQPFDPARYSAVFDERVRLLPDTTVSARLLIRYERTADYVLADYRLAGEPRQGDDVTFDSGWLYATRGDGPGGSGTYVEGLKAIRFGNDDLNRLPDLACDGGWVYFMINMALGGKGLPSGATVAPIKAPTAGPGAELNGVLAGIDGVVDGWLDAMTRSLRAQGEATKSATRRALAPECDPGWVNDVVGMGQGTVDMSRATVSAWRAALAELGKLGGRP